MKKNRIRLILISAMTVCLLLLLGMQGKYVQVRAAEPSKEEPDLERDMFVTVSPTEGAQEILDALSPENGTLVYDLYKIADVTAYQGGLFFKPVEKYQELQSDAEKENWNEVAQKALAMTVGKEGSFVNEPENATYTGCALNSKKQVEPGVYLLVTRADKKDKTVVTQITTAGADIYNGTDMTDGLATLTLLDINTFRVMPQLICVPYADNDRNKDTEEPKNEWQYEQHIVLKMEEDPATGSIEIEKTLVDYYGNAENATFVFQVDTFYPTENDLYQSEVYSIQFTQAGTKKIRIDGLPLGATIKIMEIYSGANYTASITAPDAVHVVVSADSVPVARFTNTYNGKMAGGGGVTNYFKYQIADGVGEWSWEQKSDNTTTTNGLGNKILDLIKRLTGRESE